MTDEELVVKAQAGDDAAFGELVTRHLPAVYSFLARMVQNPADAEDVAQDAFIKAWRRLHQYELGRNFKAWLYAIAHNAALDLLRKRRDKALSEFETEEGENPFLEVLADERILPEEQAIRDEEATAVAELLETLSPAYREVVLLHYHEGFTFDEIGKIVGKPLNTVKSQHRRALIALRKLLDAPNND